MYVKSGSPKSLTDLDTAFGWKAPGSEIDLRDMIQEFQGLRVSIVNGGTASALLEVKGSGGVSKSAKISTSDVIFGAIEFDNVAASGVAKLSLRNDVRIAATAGYVSISGGATSGGQILLFWLDKDGYSAY